MCAPRQLTGKIARMLEIRKALKTGQGLGRWKEKQEVRSCLGEGMEQEALQTQVDQWSWLLREGKVAEFRGPGVSLAWVPGMPSDRPQVGAFSLRTET